LNFDLTIEGDFYPHHAFNQQQEQQKGTSQATVGSLKGV